MKKIVLIALFFIVGFRIFSGNGDTLKAAKLSKHYFKTVLNVDYYGTQKTDLQKENFYANKLKNYGISQIAIGLNTPLFTKDYCKKDSTQISNFHLLLAASYVSVIPQFEGIGAHRLVKTSVGVRGIYNNGKRSVFYGEAAPFSTRDRGYRYTLSRRFASTFLYDCVVNKFFSFRVGYTRSYVFGNRRHLPYLGFRVGKLDGVNFSLQFPRSITFNVPIGKYFKSSLYTKPQGGVYTMANTDTLYYLNPDKKINFGRYEFLSGLRLDVYPSTMFNCYVSAGMTTQNFIGFYSETYNKRNNNLYKAFYREFTENAAFVNFGLVFKFGKVKSIYNNYNLYDAQDINNKNSDNIDSGNGQIPMKQKKHTQVKPNEMQDLIEVNDFY